MATNRSAAPSSVPPPTNYSIHRARPLRAGESYKLLPVDGGFQYFIVKSIRFLSSTMDWPADDFMDGVMVRAFTNNMSKAKFYELSWLDAIPGRLQAFASRAEATGTKKAHSTRERNGQIVVHTETYMRHLVRAIQKQEDEQTYLQDTYDEDEYALAYDREHLLAESAPEYSGQGTYCARCDDAFLGPHDCTGMPF